MSVEQRLRKAIEAEIDRRVLLFLNQYDLWIKNGRQGELPTSLSHDNDAAQRLQEAISAALRQRAN